MRSDRVGSGFVGPPHPDPGAFDVDGRMQDRVPQCSTLVLHRRERPVFEGLLRCPKLVAEREGLPHRAKDTSEINSLKLIRADRVYQSCAPKSSLAGPFMEKVHVFFAAQVGIHSVSAYFRQRGPQADVPRM